MADILIRGMDIPKDGRKHTALLQFLEDGKCRGIVEYSKSYDDRSVKVFEVVPLPEGHGKLIDGHKLYRALFATECGNIAADRDSEGWPKVLTYEAVKKAIQDATIIVPAEGGEADGN